MSNKRGLAIFAGLGLVIAWLANVGGAFSAVRDFYSYLTTQEAAEPVLTLAKMEGTAGLEAGTTQSRGVNLVTIQTVLRNDGEETIWAAVDKTEANLGKFECEKDGVAWRTIPIPPRMAIEHGACNMTVSMQPGERAHGRFDLSIKYGANEKALTKVLPIRGSIAVAAGDQGGRLTWLPDDDAAHPVGMIPRLAVVGEEENATEAALNDALSQQP